jgi:hypothetical protein
MKTIFAYLGSACTDDSNVSMARLLSLLTIPAVVLLPLFLWLALCIHARALLDVPASATGFMGTGAGLVLGHQFLNKREETVQENNENQGPRP